MGSHWRDETEDRDMAEKPTVSKGQSSEQQRHIRKIFLQIICTPVQKLWWKGEDEKIYNKGDDGRDEHLQDIYVEWEGTGERT